MVALPFLSNSCINCSGSPLAVLCWLLDVVYPNRPIRRFWYTLSGDASFPWLAS